MGSVEECNGSGPVIVGDFIRKSAQDAI